MKTLLKKRRWRGEINKHGHESWHLSLPPSPNNNQHTVNSNKMCHESDVYNGWNWQLGCRVCRACRPIHWCWWIFRHVRHFEPSLIERPSIPNKQLSSEAIISVIILPILEQSIKVFLCKVCQSANLKDCCGEAIPFPSIFFPASLKNSISSRVNSTILTWPDESGSHSGLKGNWPLRLLRQR